ncbi:MAG: winged helix-turn-helix transcriptional regulator [Undibacterium sp.]|nr:winged helix-turn-helix transcriptional regulator [Opitutaceae bacterium]
MPRPLDDQDKAIARQLIRNPRTTDKSISGATGVQLRTVGRKRQKLERAGLIRYWASVDLSETGTGQYNASHLYIIKFALGVTYDSLRAVIRREPQLSELSAITTESHIAEIDGKLALLFAIDGTSDRDIVQNVHERLIPNLIKNHGPNSILEVSTLRLLSPIRTLRNYLSLLNMTGSAMRPDWPDKAIYAGK